MLGFVAAVCIVSTYAEITKCELDKFRCRNGECIAGYLLCDGKVDCRDASDETQSECKKSENLCSSLAFRCNYGACIDGNLICNGVKDCIDNSDETLPQCDTTDIVNGSDNLSPCKSFQFRCDNGQCIPEIEACDGIRNCADGSDETSVWCRSLLCAVVAFRCAYGACIDSYLQCDGVINCADGSDEDSQVCSGKSISTWKPAPSKQPSTEETRPQTTRPQIVSRATSCIAPPQPQNGRWTLNSRLCLVRQNCDFTEVIDLPAGSQLIYSCNEGYKLNGSAVVSCTFEGNWLYIPECREIRCKALNSVSTRAMCGYTTQEKWVPCDSSVLPRTRAMLKCRNNYRRVNDRRSISVICNETGKWDPEPIQCVAACGTLPAKNISSFLNGYRSNIADFPWHASLYRGESKTYICGASIIKENLLITAAHCVYSERDKRPIDPTKIHIMTGNIYRHFDLSHNETIVQKRQVSNIYFTCNYIDSRGSVGAEIAILQVDRPFEKSAYLIPICIDLFNALPVLKQNSTIKLPAFDRPSATSTSSGMLQALEMSYGSIDQCTSAAQNTDTEQYISSHDKFCARYTNGSFVCDGDSGNGVVVFSDGLWYLRGVVTSSLGLIQEVAVIRCNHNMVTIFTQISSHVSFIHDILSKLERKQQPTCSNGDFT